MNYTKDEIDNIKAKAFDAGWRMGILFAIGMCVAIAIVVSILI